MCKRSVISPGLIISLIVLFASAPFSAFAQQTSVFTDDFSTFTGWSDYGTGSVEQSNLQANSGTYSLRKINNNHPNGAIKPMGTTVLRNFTSEGWIYRPSTATGGARDRIALLNSSNDGYGLNILGNNISIERYDGTSNTTVSSTANWNRTDDEWYRYKFEANDDDTFTLTIYNSSGVQQATVTSNVDATYTNFDRVAVLGGYEYYVDDIDVSITTYYTFQSGNYNNANVWTTDPSGTLLLNSAVPSPGDNIVILNGRSVTSVANNLNLNTVEIGPSATLNLVATTGHTFTSVEGRGTLRLDTNSLPTADYTQFFGSVGGTLEFSGASDFNLPGETSLHNLKISGSGNKTLANDLDLSGNLIIDSGTLTIGNDGTSRSLVIDGDATLESSGNLRVGQFNTVHDIDIYGSLLNNGGEVILHNSAIDGSPTPQNSDYTGDPTNGAADLEFLGESNEELIADGRTDLNRIIVNKGQDQTYILEVRSDNASNFKLFGRNNQSTADIPDPTIDKSVWIRRGTLRLKANLDIPSLTEGGRDLIIPENGRLWIDGADVFVTTTSNGSGSQGLKIFGTFRISNGTFDTRNSAGIVFRESGVIQVEGGSIRASQIRRSGTSSGSNFTSYIQLGGTVIVDGAGETTGSTAAFAIDKPESVFQMSGGVLRISDNTGNSVGGLFVESSTENFSVTGGTIEIDVSSQDIEVSLPGEINNLRAYNGNNRLEMDNDLIINGDLTVETNAELFANAFDLTAKGNITFDGDYNVGNTTFAIQGDENSSISIGNGSALQLYNFTIDKEDAYLDSVIITNASATAFDITNNLNHNSGVVSLNSYNVSVQSDATINAQFGIEGNTGLVSFDGSSAQTISLNPPLNSPSFPTLRINNSNNVTVNGTTGDSLYVYGDLRIDTGLINIGKVQLVVFDQITSTGGLSASRMVQTDGQSSNGGLSIRITGNGSYSYPFGTGTYYSPATLTTSNVADTGFVQVNPVDSELPSLNGTGDALTYYWRVRNNSFTTLPDVSYTFEYDQNFVAGNEANYYAGKVIGSARSYEDPAPSGPPSDNVDENNNIITFDNEASGSGTFPLEQGYYTAGISTRFQSVVQVFYTRNLQDAATANWTNGNLWTLAPNDLDSNGEVDDYELHDSRQPAAGDYPQAGDIAVIGWAPFGDPNETNGNPHGIAVNGAVEFAELRFSKMLDVSGNPNARQYSYNFQFRPTVCINPGGSLNGDIISGEGLFWLRSTGGNQVDIDFSTIDIGDFVREDSSYYVYESTNNGFVYDNIPAQVPNLMIAGNNWGGANRDFEISTDVRIKQNFEILGDANLVLSSGATGDFIVENDLQIFRLNINGNDSGGDGEIRYPNDADRVIEVLGNLKLINNQAQVFVQNPNTTVNTHQLIVHGDIEQDNNSGGGLQLYTALNEDYIELILNGGKNQTISRTSGAIPDLFRITVDKSSGSTATISTDFNLNGPSDGAVKPINLQRGGLTLNNAGIDVSINSGGADFQIPANTAFTVANGTARITGTASTGIRLDGKLEISGGNLILGDNDGNDDNYIEYSGSGNAELTISAGQLTVGSQMRRAFLSPSGTIAYSQTGGSAEFGRYEVPNNSRGTFEILDFGSSFTHTNGDLIITLEQPNNAVAGFYYNPTTVNATAPIQIGSANTPNSSTIDIDAGKSIGTLIISNAATNLNADVVINPLTVNTELEIQTGTQLNTNGLTLSIGGDLTADGTLSAASSNLILNGNGTNTASLTNNTTVSSLEVDKSSGTITFQGAGDLSISNNLTIDSGTLDDGGSTISVSGNVTNRATHSSTGSGNLTLTGTATQTIENDNNSSFGNLDLNNSNGFAVVNDMSVTGDITISDGILNLGSYGLELSGQSNVTGTFNNTRMIRTDGSLNASGISQTVPAGASIFLIPLGVSGKYTPAEFNFSANTTQGILTIKPINTVQNSAIDGQDDLLDFYWSVSEQNFGTYTLTHTYTYDQSDVQTATSAETDYVWGRFFNGVWSEGTQTSDIDESANEISISSVNFISGDFTAGSPDEFGILATYYSNSTKAGITSAPGVDWNETDSWSLVDWNDPNHGTPAEEPSVVPAGNRVEIKDGHFIFLNSNNARSGNLVLDGTLDLQSTTSHILGTVTGTGTLINGSNTVVFPSGDFSAFNGTNGGTVIYNANEDVTLPPRSTYWNLIIETSNQRTRSLPAANITVGNDLEIKGNAQLDANNRTIRVRGDWINNSAHPQPFEPGTGSNVIFDGSTNQSIGGSTETIFRNLRIANNQTGNTLNSDITVEGTLTMQSGRMNLNGQTITIEPTATISETQSHYITGPTGSIVTTRNLSSSPGNVGGLGFNITFSAQAPGNTTITRSHAQATGNGITSILRVFDVNATTNTGLNASVEFSYLDSELSGQTEADIILYRRPSSGNWVPVGGAVNVGANTIFATGINAFSDWTADESSSLPVNLIAFDVRNHNNLPMLWWETAVEINNYGFRVERLKDVSEEGDSTWTSVGFIEGQGTTTEPQSYTFLDHSASEAIEYEYRLLQIDYDNATKLYGPVTFTVPPPNKTTLKQNYPNPFNPVTTIPYTIRNAGNVQIEVYNILGQKVTTLVDNHKNAGTYSVQFNANRLSSGVYFIRMISAGYVYNKKITLIK